MRQAEQNEFGVVLRQRGEMLGVQVGKASHRPQRDESSPWHHDARSELDPVDHHTVLAMARDRVGTFDPFGVQFQGRVLTVSRA